MTEFINTLESEFARNSNPQVASEQEKYLRGRFECYGLKTTLRREVQKPFLEKAFLPEKATLTDLVTILWQKPQREYQYFAQELAAKYLKQQEKHDIELYEYMVSHKSWWETVDFIATKLMGNYFKVYPSSRHDFVNKWIASGNSWLQRSALLFQLKYKQELDEELLTLTINPLLGSEDFFINKAIGWILREHSRTNPSWVLDFTEQTALSTLSHREALKLINQ